MKTLKKLAYALLIVGCLCVLAWCGIILVRTVFPVTMQPQVLDLQELFEEKEQELPREEEPVQEEPVEEVPQTVSAREQAAAYLQTMTMSEKLWQLILTTPDSLTGVPGATEAGQMTKQALAQMPVGGLCYFSANLEDKAQISAMLSGVQEFSKTPLFLAVDEEGGVVSRLSTVEDLGIGNIGAAAEFRSSQAVYDAACGLAPKMKELGFNLNFAPVADLAVEGNTEIGSRAYSAEAEVVAEYSAAMVRGLQEHGVAACLKHFPGHGWAQSDSHEGKSVAVRTIHELRQEEFTAFRGGVEAGVRFVMMSHLTNEALSAHPSSLSEETVSLLRKELGFGGIIITDSLQMRAIVDTYTSSQAAVMAIAAGCDMLLMPNDPQKAYDGLATAVLDGTISQQRIDESVLRILTTKYEMGVME